MARIRELLAAGDDIDDRSRDGWSALDMAIRWQQAEVFRFLLDQGASIHRGNDGGQRVLQLAEGRHEFVDPLVQRGARGRSGHLWILHDDEDTTRIPRDELVHVAPTNDDIYAVYTAVYLSIASRGNTLITVQRETIGLPPDWIIDGKDPIADLTQCFRFPWRRWWRKSAGIVEDFVTRNQHSMRLEHRVESVGEYRFDDERLPADSPEPATGVFGVSLPGFNHDCTLAMLYQDYYAGPRAAEGALLLLAKSDERWSVVQRDRLWVS